LGTRNHKGGTTVITAAIFETQVVSLVKRYWERKASGLVIDVACDLAKTDHIYVGTGLKFTTSVDVYTSVLGNLGAHYHLFICPRLRFPLISTSKL